MKEDEDVLVEVIEVRRWEVADSNYIFMDFLTYRDVVYKGKSMVSIFFTTIINSSLEHP